MEMQTVAPVEERGRVTPVDIEYSTQNRSFIKSKFTGK